MYKKNISKKNKLKKQVNKNKRTKKEIYNKKHKLEKNKKIEYNKVVNSKNKINKQDGGEKFEETYKHILGKIDITTMRSVYNDDSKYQFPQWVKNDYFNEKDDMLKSVQIYYDSGEDLNDVKELLLKREPFNVAMKRYYDQYKLENILGWKFGAYQTLFDNSKKLPPNIAVYCKTMVKDIDIDKYYNVNCINLIGYAFDNNEQVDFEYFLEERYKFKTDKENKLILRYKQVWIKAFECAQRNKLNTIYFAKIGGGFFSKYLPKGFYDNKIEGVVKEISKKYKIEVKWMDTQNFLVPSSFKSLTEEQLNNTLFINAWDPWSFVGNGNTVDNSLDGYWGRSSCMAPQCWSGFNKYIIDDSFIKIESNETKELPLISLPKTKSKSICELLTLYI